MRRQFSRYSSTALKVFPNMTAKYVLIVSTLALMAAQQLHGARQDAQWTVSLTVSQTPGGEYEGEVEVLMVFEDQTQHSTILPSTKYFLGLNYDFPLSLPSAGPVQAAYVRTKGFCPLGLLPIDLLRISRLQLVSNSPGLAYTKDVDDLALKDACQSTSQGTQFADFRVDTIQHCTVDGVQRLHAERFDMGCEGRCQCSNGSVSCVDMCAAEAWDPERQCRFVRVPGQCCEDIVCKDDETIGKCQEPKPGMLVTSDKKPVRRYPWSIMFCINEKCAQIYGGVVVGERQILTFAPDASYLKQLYVATGRSIIDQSNSTDFTPYPVVNVTSHEDFVNHNSPIADGAARLQVIEFEGSFPYDKFFQPANLPLNEEHCRQLSNDQCPQMTVGWDRTDFTDDSIRQWWLHAESARRDESLCARLNSSTSTGGVALPVVPRRRGEKRACLGGMGREDCTGPSGGAVVANAGENVDFVVGLTDPDSALLFCERPGTADVLPLCKYIGWIDALLR